jgi:hypothetical protein
MGRTKSIASHAANKEKKALKSVADIFRGPVTLCQQFAAADDDDDLRGQSDESRAAAAVKEDSMPPNAENHDAVDDNGDDADPNAVGDNRLFVKPLI